MTWRAKVVEAFLCVIAAVVMARVVLGLLGPLLPSLLGLLIIGAVVVRLLRGPHARR